MASHWNTYGGEASGQSPPLPPRPQQQQQRQQQQTQQPFYPPPPSAPTQYNQYGSAPNQYGSTPYQTTPPPSPGMRDRLYQLSIKAGGPINRLTHKLGSEAFWPSSLDQESNKAARILRSFCHDGFYTDRPEDGAAPGPKGKPTKTLVKIPASVIRSAAGLAIFTTFRSALHLSGAGGSGIVVARLPDGSWSPPSGFLVHTLGAGFMIGLDIYDCVCVLRTPAAVQAFTHPRLSLGGEIGLVAGPVGAGGAVEAALAKAGARPIFCYMKSRGLYVGIQADGTIIVGRPDANAEFYGQRGISVDQILSGRVPWPQQPPSGFAVNSTGASTIPPWPVAVRQLMEVLKAAEGRQDIDYGLLRDVGAGPTPGDLGLADSDHYEHPPAGEYKGRWA
ncbi:duf500 domain containing protein [Grosmannia clavigera kw1407]|uniref:Duf500 domain containing protein n=1 Tax=Grosmannia clavigera (strain kw1407 / UAMH 11150) TaxID=655863 RepID=F0XP25_GROCL|nr:duf500 domain containing protein [Grosmannia clavigera kw1407]EFX00105.1 duf500 domain containing protein [Grosmannia clavigera kw1407]